MEELRGLEKTRKLQGILKEVFLRMACLRAESSCFSLVDALEVLDQLDQAKEVYQEMRLGPTTVGNLYVRVRTAFREVVPRLHRNPDDAYGRRMLGECCDRLERGL
jgi:hypothetical protein